MHEIAPEMGMGTHMYRTKGNEFAFAKALEYHVRNLAAEHRHVRHQNTENRACCLSVFRRRTTMMVRIEMAVLVCSTCAVSGMSLVYAVVSLSVLVYAIVPLSAFMYAVPLLSVFAHAVPLLSALRYAILWLSIRQPSFGLVAFRLLFLLFSLVAPLLVLL